MEANVPAKILATPCEKTGLVHLECQYPGVTTIAEALFHMAALGQEVNTGQIGGVLNPEDKTLTVRCFVWPEVA